MPAFSSRGPMMFEQISKLHMSDTYTTVVGSGSDQERIAAVVETGSSPAFIAGHLLDSVRVMRAEEELARRLVELGLEGSARVRRIALPEDRGALLRFVREWEQKHRRAVTAGTIATLVLPLAACGGGGGGGYRPPVDEGDSGWVIDGYVSAATVSRENGSGNTVTTDASGRFTGLTGTGPNAGTRRLMTRCMPKAAKSMSANIKIEYTLDTVALRRGRWR